MLTKTLNPFISSVLWLFPEHLKEIHITYITPILFDFLSTFDFVVMSAFIDLILFMYAIYYLLFLQCYLLVFSSMSVTSERKVSIRCIITIIIYFID